jgi:hypothetical protein
VALLNLRSRRGASLIFSDQVLKVNRLSWVDLDTASLLRPRDCQTTRSCAYCLSFLEASGDLASRGFSIEIHREPLEQFARKPTLCNEKCLTEDSCRCPASLVPLQLVSVSLVTMNRAGRMQPCMAHQRKDQDPWPDPVGFRDSISHLHCMTLNASLDGIRARGVG